MYAQANKEDNRNLKDYKQQTQQEVTADSAMKFQDNRPENRMLTQIQAFADNSLQSKKTAQFQEMSGKASSEKSLPIQKRENNTGLPDQLKSGIENLSGYSLDDVKVHYNSDKPAQLQAHAYAQGTDIHVASGQEKHLPHEAWHVVQQKQGRVQPTVQLKAGVNVNDDAGLEKEADVMGEKAMQFKQIDESPANKSGSLQTEQVAQLQVNEGSDSSEENDDAELKSLLAALSQFSLSDVEGADIDTDESEPVGIDELSNQETDDSEEEIQLAKNPAVIQMGRGPAVKNRKYYLNKLAKSFHLLMRLKGLMETGYVRLTNKKDLKQMFNNLNQTLHYFRDLRFSKSQTISNEMKDGIERVAFFNTRLYYKNIKQLGGPGNLSPEIRFFLGLNDSGVKQSVLVNWYNEIKNRNKQILKLISQSSDPRQHPWFLMDYEDIIDSQSDEADQAIQDGIEFLMEYGNNDVSYVCKHIFNYISSKKYYLPLVSFINAQKALFYGKNVIQVNYSINPSYTKYVDPTKTGQGSEGIQILGDSTDTKVKTDIRFIPGSLTVGDESSPVGMQMEAKRLSQDSPVGSEAGKDSSQDKLMGNINKIMGNKSTKYVKGHLLNDHLGGPARPYNLFPITEQANNDHLVFMEKYVKAEVAKGYVMYYKVNITNPTVHDLNSSAVNHKRRYSVNADIECESAKLDAKEQPIEKHNITVKSVWSGGDVLDSTGTHIKKKGDTSLVGTDIATHGEFTRKLKSGKPDQGVTNPDVKDPDSKTHLIYKKTGYDQDDMHKGKLSDSNLTNTVTGAIPFSISGNKDDISTAMQPAVASVVGKHIAKLIWASSLITSGKLKAGVTELELKSIKGVGPVSIKKLKDNFEIK